MQVVHAPAPLPEAVTATIFLAGPSPRGEGGGLHWRGEALELLAQAGFTGHVFVPLPAPGQSWPADYIDQAGWEQTALERADVVLFWIPRELERMPGFTTNVEFGQHCRGRNVVLGHPVDAPKCRFLDFLAERNFIAVSHTLAEAVERAVAMVGEGAARRGGECQVPLYLWRTPSFAGWLAAQRSAGNRLDGCRVELSFGVGPRRGFLMFWAAHVDVHVAAEGRNKSNELVIGRPDIMHVVGLAPAPEGSWLDARVILVREFRSPAATRDGFVHELPGGSSFTPGRDGRALAALELEEETGVAIAAERFVARGARQCMATLLTHRAELYSVELTADEIAAFRARVGQRFGENESERTYVEVRTVAEILAADDVDWTHVGMILSVLGPPPGSAA
ncbi:MAG: hypothetical protein KC431_02660 [Myxococcales bacterium]|nr:hypothetical protein [Myxococcales bacterium]